jgi:hypothetical protein
VVKEVNTKRYIGFYGWISGEVCEDLEIHNAQIEKARNKIRAIPQVLWASNKILRV